MFSEGYIGISGRFEERMKQYQKNKGNVHLTNAIKKYGWDNLVKQILIVSDKAYCLMIEAKLRAEDKIGWNLVKGGGMPPPAFGNKNNLGKTSWNKGISPSEETKRKISEATRLQMQDPARRDINRQLLIGKPSLMKGKKHSIASLLKISLSKLGKPTSKKGMKYSQETKDKMNKTMYANPWTCPHCSKVGYNTGAANRWHFDNCKNKERHICL
jgi:group I intron endonuclease